MSNFLADEMHILYIIIIVTLFVLESFLRSIIHKLFLESIILIEPHKLLVFVIEVLIRSVLEYLIDSLLLWLEAIFWIVLWSSRVLWSVYAIES